jgi:diadenosine tetraphosphatase ApaH/serine/threonine PP2A family protein phosphatase
MKSAILSDVHGNLEALQAVLEDVRSAGADEIWSLGDVVGYGPDPEACVEILYSEAAVNLMGNHDAAVAGLTSEENFNISARLAVVWTRSAVSETTMKILGALPYTTRREGVFLVHASPRSPEEWHYIMGLRDAEEAFEEFGEEVCFVGHTHAPFIAALPEGDRVRLLGGSRTPFLRDSRYIVNVGSVGQPRDGDPRASYALLDGAAGLVEIRRVAYPVETTQAKMRKAGLPAFLYERLKEGR